MMDGLNTCTLGGDRCFNLAKAYFSGGPIAKVFSACPLGEYSAHPWLQTLQRSVNFGKMGPALMHSLAWLGSAFDASYIFPAIPLFFPPG